MSLPADDCPRMMRDGRFQCRDRILIYLRRGLGLAEFGPKLHPPKTEDGGRSFGNGVGWRRRLAEEQLVQP
ncbi:hypothetical protein MTP99_010453 [Tenebrio molitor]|nr:hypothetical protein MTP99_010453 [Tenebrio molitor]